MDPVDKSGEVAVWVDSFAMRQRTSIEQASTIPSLALAEKRCKMTKDKIAWNTFLLFLLVKQIKSSCEGL